MGLPAAWASSVTLSDLDPAECQPNSAIAFELASVLASKAERQHQFATGGRNIDPNLLPSLATLLDAPSFEKSGHTRHPWYGWIEDGTAIVCGRSIAGP